MCPLISNARLPNLEMINLKARIRWSETYSQNPDQEAQWTAKIQDTTPRNQQEGSRKPVHQVREVIVLGKCSPVRTDQGNHRHSKGYREDPHKMKQNQDRQHPRQTQWMADLSMAEKTNGAVTPVAAALVPPAASQQPCSLLLLLLSRKVGG